MCDHDHYTGLEERVDKIDSRLTRVETSISTGFTQVHTAVDKLASDFGNRMNTLDLRIVEEKAKWGDTLRLIVKVVAYALVTAALFAVGINVAKTFFN